MQTPKKQTIFQLLLLFGVLIGVKVSAQVVQPKTLGAVQISDDVKIDGRLDESFWKEITPARQFIQVEPHQGKISEFPSEIKVGYNKKGLYFGVICFFKKGENSLRITSLQRDFTITDQDAFAIVIDGFNDKRNAMVFATNTHGAQFDELSFDASSFDPNWNGLWQVKTSTSDSCWTAEFEIPWKTLRYNIKGTGAQTWGINFLRVSRAANEVSVWSPYPRSYDITRMDFAGLLTDLLPPENNANIQVTPYVLGTKTKSDAYPENSVKAGGDLKWAINTKTVLDLTVNPDFAQAEADVQVSNVTRYSVYFPEKRAFFLENASFFGGGLNLSGSSAGGNMQIQSFNSRSIGLDTAGIPVPISAAARLVHRSQTDNYGGIFAVENPGQGEDLYKGTFRYSRNFSQQDHFGFVTNFNLHQGKGSPDNVVTGADLFLRFNKEQSFSAQLLHSSSGALGEGMAGYAQYFFTNNAVQAWLTEAFVSTHYVNNLGFTSRNNVIVTSPGAYPDFRNINWMPLHKYIRSYDPSIAADINQDYTTKQVSDYDIRIFPFYVNFNSGAYLAWMVKPSYQNLTADFTPLGINIGPGVYHFTRNRFYYGSDASKKISYTASFETGPYYNGKLNIYSASLRVNPIVNVSTTASLTLDDVKNLGTANVTRTVSLLTINNQFALNPKLLLAGLLQFNNQDHSFGTNVRLSWEYKPLSYLYILYNNVQPFNNTNPSYVVENYNQVGFKLSYLHQF